MPSYTELDVQIAEEGAPASWANQVRTNQQHFRERRRYYTAQVVPPTGSIEVGNGAHYFEIPAHLSTMILVEILGSVVTPGTGSLMEIQIRNVPPSRDMLSTKLSIDPGEDQSYTAAVPAVIDPTKDDVLVNNIIRVDIDAVHTTPAKGLFITFGFAEQ